MSIKVSQTETRTRVWEGEELAAFLQTGLEPLPSKMIDDLVLEVVGAKAADIRFDWKPERVGKLIGTVMEDIEPNGYLSE